jgi:hypothetical protein
MADQEEGLLKNPLTIVVVGLLLMGVIVGAGALNAPQKSAATVHWLNASDSLGVAEIEKIADDGSSVYSIATGVAGAYVGAIVVQKWTVAGVSAATKHFKPINGSCEALGVLATDDRIILLSQGADLLGNRMLSIHCEAKDLAHTLWDRTYEMGSGKTFGQAMTVYDDRLFVAGSALNPEGGRSAIVAAFNLNTGALLWTYESKGMGAENQFYDVAADLAGVYAIGYHGSMAGYCVQVVSLAPGTGREQWNFIYGGEANSTHPAIISVDEGKVTMSGYLSLRNGTPCAVSCGLSTAGALLWESVDYAGGSLGTDGRILNGQMLLSGLWHGKFYAGSFSTATGAKKWADSVAITGEANFHTAMDLGGDRLVVAFFDQSVNHTGEYSWKMMVRAYDPLSGKVLQTELKTGVKATSDGICLDILGDNIFASSGTPGIYVQGGLAAEETKTVVTTDGYALKVNGQNFTFKGVNYAPSPINVIPDYEPWGDYFQDGWQAIWDRDIPAIKEMNANTLKLYGMTAFKWSDPTKKKVDHSAFYTMLHDNGLYVIPMVWFDWNYMKNVYNPSNWDGTDVAVAWKWMVAEAKQYPAVIGYCVSNEQNPGWLASDRSYWIDHTYDLVSHVKDMDPDRMTTISLQDDNQAGTGTKEVHNWNDLMPKLDAWSICLYRANISQAIGFTDIFNTYEANTAVNKKPMIVSEFGCPASLHNPPSDPNAVQLLPANANATAEYIRICWNGAPVYHDDIMSNLAYNASGVHKVCVGGFVFEWTDEWCKGDKQAWLHTGDNAPNPNYPGGSGDEKWFGINGVETVGRGHHDPFDPTINQPDALSPRAAYYMLKSLWA